jgi:hypothetical protein
VHGDERLAFDKASVRTIDTDGRMHVEVTPISKANVCEYYGREIPNGAELGLRTDKLYKLLRDPEELKKGAPTFNNLPLLRRHVRTSAANPQRDDIVGSTGSDAEFKEPYLTNSLAIWDAVAIQGVISEEQCELSSSYHYVADMTPGEYKGDEYDGVMRQIRGNHVALVTRGRAGPDVVVGDEFPKSKEFQPMAHPANALSRKALYAAGALHNYLQPKLAADAAIDIPTMLKGVTAKNWDKKQPSIVAAITKATEGKLAADADVGDVVDLLKAVGQSDTGTEADPMDPADPVTGDADTDYFKDKLSPEDHAKLCAMVAGKGAEPPVKDADPDEGAKPNDNDQNAAAAASAAAKKDDEEAPMMKPAMDAAIAAATAKVRKETIAHMNAIRTAEDAVRPFVGPVAVAMDSAAEVYKLALDAAQVDLTDVPEAAFAAMVRMLPKPGSEQTPKKSLAMDAAAASGFAKRFPNAARIRVA